MILTENVKIKISRKNIKHLKNKGYNCNLKDIIDVKVKDLTFGSHIKIKVKCDICGTEKILTYQNYFKGFINSNFYACSSKCALEKVKKTNIKKFGVDSVFKNVEIKEKIKKKCLEKYGVEYPSQLIENREKARKTTFERFGFEYATQNKDVQKKTEKTNFERYGCKAPTQNKKVLKKRENVYLEKFGFITNLMCEDTKEKIKKTCLELYGFENVSQNQDIKDKKIETCNRNYGVDNPLQNSEIFDKVQKSAHQLKAYKNYTYRGTYELDFLKKFSDTYKIEKAISIDYDFEGKRKKYHPDYYIPQYNLIVEIKSSYTYECEKEQNEAKKEATISKGFNFLFIINKNYTELISLLG